MKNRKKGFTIVELVIVIAVIAILAAVLIPNLSRLVGKANESARLQEVESALKVMLMNQTDGALDETVFAITDGSKTYTYTYENGELGKEVETTSFSAPEGTVAVTATTDKLEVETNEKYTIEKVEGLGKVTVYLTKDDARQFDGATKVTTESSSTSTT